MPLFVLIAPQGNIHYAGLHDDEAGVWQVALGWPDEAEIQHFQLSGYYVSAAKA